MKTKSLWIVCLCILLAACVKPVFIKPVSPTSTPVAPTRAVSAPATLASGAAATPANDPFLDLQRAAMRPDYAADLALYPAATRYHIRLVIDSLAAPLRGQQTVYYTNTETLPLEALYFRLFPATPSYGGAVTVTRLALNGQAVQTSLEQDGSAVRVPLAPPLAPGQATMVEMSFVISVPHDTDAGYAQFNYAQGILTLPNFYPLIPAYDQTGWHTELPPGYGDAVYSDSALYTVEVETPPGDLVSSGSCSLTAATTGDRQHWQCASGLARDFMLAFGDAYEVSTQDVNGVTVRSFYLPDHADAGRAALDYAARSMEIYSRRFGSYPFAEMDVIETPTTAGGIEYPGLVVIAANLYEEQSDFFEWVIAHEMAHQWWYSLVGNDQVNAPWLDEAMAQYSTILYYEDAHDRATGDYLVHSVFEQAYDAVVARDEDAPVDQPVAAFTADAYGDIVYQKGPLFFHALRQAAGEDKFNAFLHAYYRRHCYGVATPDSLLATAQETLDRATLQSLYDEWIKGVRRP